MDPKLHTLEGDLVTLVNRVRELGPTYLLINGWTKGLHYWRKGNIKTSDVIHAVIVEFKNPK